MIIRNKTTCSDIICIFSPTKHFMELFVLLFISALLGILAFRRERWWCGWAWYLGQADPCMGGPPVGSAAFLFLNLLWRVSEPLLPQVMMCLHIQMLLNDEQFEAIKQLNKLVSCCFKNNQLCRSLLETFSLKDCLDVYLQHLSYFKSIIVFSWNFSHLRRNPSVCFVCYGKGF